MAEEKKTPRPAPKKPAKKQPMDVSLHSLNKMAIKGHKKRKEEK